MLECSLRLLRLVCLFSRGHQTLVLENLALRQQIAVLKRKQKQLRLTRWDRWFWIFLAGYWKGWGKHLFIVHPDTVVRWQRRRFATYWARLSKTEGQKLGRPRISKKICELIQMMAGANPLWRAPRIHGELEGDRSETVLMKLFKDHPPRIATVPTWSQLICLFLTMPMSFMATSGRWLVSG